MRQHWETFLTASGRMWLSSSAPRVSAARETLFSYWLPPFSFGRNWNNLICFNVFERLCTRLQLIWKILLFPPPQVLAQNLRKRTERVLECIKIKWIQITVLSLLCVPSAIMLLSLLFLQLMYLSCAFQGFLTLLEIEKLMVSRGGWAVMGSCKIHFGFPKKLLR